MTLAAIDAHHHLWDPGLRPYPWMDDSVARLRRPFLVDTLQEAAALTPVQRTVVVQSLSSAEETEWLRHIAATTEWIAGVVGWIDLTSPTMTAELAESLDGKGKLRGYRHQLYTEEDPAWITRPIVNANLREVGAAGLSFDLLVDRRTSSAALEAVRANPDLMFVIDHAGNPGPADEHEIWLADLRAMAGAGNVACKLSGLLTNAGRRNMREVRTVMDVVLDLFGVDKCLWGSDWPISLLAHDYASTFQTAFRWAEDFSESERDRIFRDNAVSVYKLGRI